MTLCDELLNLNFPGDAQRLNVVVDFLRQQEIDCVRELAGKSCVVVAC